MKNLVYFLLLFALPMTACAQAGKPDTSPERKARIIENLKYHFPQLAGPQVASFDIRFDSSDVAGFDKGMLLINGQEAQPFVVSKDDEALFLVAAGPFDVSMDEAGRTAARAEQDAKDREEALERHEQLQQAIADFPVRGNRDAPVTIVEFSDFQCPYCAQVAPNVEEVLARNEDVNFVYIHFPLPNHPWAEPAAIAAMCAANQNEDAYWGLHDYYFDNQRQINPNNVILRSRDFLAAQGLDMAQWETCATDTSSEAYQTASELVQRGLQLGSQFGITGTPGFFVNGRQSGGAIPVSEFEQLISKARADRGDSNE